MNIVVCVKQVPDTWAERKLKDADGTLDRASVDGLINELDEYAIEEGLQIAEAQRAAGHEAEVTILTMGPDRAAESIRKALSMGADKAVHLLDDGLAGSDALSTSYALAQVLSQTGFDLVICGSESTDARMGVMAAMLAERLDVPQVSLASKVEIDGSAIRVRRVSEDGYFEVESTLPAVISVVEKINEPRYPSFKGIMAAKKKPVQTMTLADAGIDSAAVGLGGAATEVVDHAQRPPRQVGVVVKDEGDGGVKAAEFLAARKFI
jgi:electron transfer flavoprotein beta subunit